MNAQENSDLQNIEDIQNQILQSLNDSNSQETENTETSDILEILESNAEIIAEEQEKEKLEQEQEEKRIAEQKEKEQQQKKAAREQKRQNNYMTGYLGGGVNFTSPIAIDYPSNVVEINSPVGLSFSAVTSMSYIALKLNVECDFIKYYPTQKDESVFTALSVGFTPVHNNYIFLGFFGTFGLDTIGSYSYTSFGASATFMVHLGNFFVVYTNIDATRRSKGKIKDDAKESIGFPSLYSNTWRISPSVGIAIRLM